MPARDVRGQLHLPWAVGSDELDELRDARERYHKEREANAHTIKTERKVFKILRELDVHKIDGLMQAEDICRRFREHCEGKGWRPTTRDTLHGTLIAIIRFACQRYGRPVPRLPKRTKPGSRKWRELHPAPARSLPTPEAYGRLMEYLEGCDTVAALRLLAMVLLISTTAIPQASALRLKLPDVDDFLLRRITHHPRRSRRAHHEPMRPRLRRVLQQWKEYCVRQEHEWLFPDPRDPARHWTPVDACRSLADACHAAGVSRMTFEQLRRYDPTQGHAQAHGRTDDSPASAEGHDEVDFDTIADQLVRKGRGLRVPAALVRFMKGRQSASFAEINEAIYGGAPRKQGTFRTLPHRTNDALSVLKSPLRFRTNGDCIERVTLSTR